MTHEPTPTAAPTRTHAATPTSSPTPTPTGTNTATPAPHGNPHAHPDPDAHVPAHRDPDAHVLADADADRDEHGNAGTTPTRTHTPTPTPTSPHTATPSDADADAHGNASTHAHPHAHRDPDAHVPAHRDPDAHVPADADADRANTATPAPDAHPHAHRRPRRPRPRTPRPRRRRRPGRTRPTPTPTRTHTPTHTATPTPTPRHTATPTPTPTHTATSRPTASKSASTPSTRKSLARPEPHPAPASPPSLPSPPAVSPGAASPPLVPVPPAIAVGYALPVPAGVVAADPTLIGEGSPAPRRTEPAGPVTLPVAPGTAVNAVTAGTLKVIPAGDGTSTIVLSGTDGATYTYRNVTARMAQRTRMNVGTQIGVSGPGGLTFSISVPDVRGAVDADEALQAWASGLSVNVRALPSTIAPATAAPARRQVLLVTDAGAGTAAADVAKSVAGQMVRVQTDTVGDPRSVGGQAPAAQQIAAPGGQQLVVVVLANGTPAQAAALAARLPAGHDLLWVAPPGTTPKRAAAYRAIVAARPGFRVESLPAALAAVNAPAVNGLARSARATSAGSWSPAGALATATLVAAYASTAYRLESVSAQARTEVSWAEEQLGKPYQWGAAGPGSFDCSGLTMVALAQAGISVTHNANAQWQQTKAHPVAENQLAPGDLVFYAGSDGSLTAPGHVGIYVGDGEIIDAPFTGANVRFDPLTSISGYVGATDPYAVTPTAGTTAPIPPSGNLAATAPEPVPELRPDPRRQHLGAQPVPLSEPALGKRVRLEPRRDQPGLRRVRHPPGAARRKDGISRTGLGN